MAFGTGLSVAGLNSMTKFQSLFFWNGLWDHALSAVPGRQFSVSILVFLEWPLGRRHVVNSEQWCRLVSILVFLEWPLGQWSQWRVCG